ncbi:MAG: hypothetical protein AAFZ65_00735 [Planctomycetota bacterium]
MAAHLRPLSTAEILDGAFTLLRRQIGLFLAISGVFIALVAPLMFVVPVYAISILAGGVFIVRDGALLWAAAELAQGHSVRLGQALKRGVFLFLPLIAARILFFLAFLPIVILLVGVVMVASLVLGEAAFVLLLGALPLLAFVFASWFAWQQLVVVEREFNFVRHSTRLAKGARWKILGVSLVAYLIVGLPQTVVLGTRVAASGWDLSVLSDPEAMSAGTLIAQWVIAGLTTPFWVLTMTLLYFDRRVRVEGYDVEQSVAELEQAIEAT